MAVFSVAVNWFHNNPVHKGTSVHNRKFIGKGGNRDLA